MSKLDDIFHRIRTRALRGAPIHGQHIEEAQDQVKALYLQLLDEVERDWNVPKNRKLRERIRAL